MTPDQIAAATNDVRKKVEKSLRGGNGFECALCRIPKPSSDALFIGVFVPNATMVTEAGEKQRIIGYALCKWCTKKLAPDGKNADRKVTDRIEQNLITDGVLLDPTYYPPG